MMHKKSRADRLIIAAIAFAAVFCAGAPSASAMHIMEGYLPLGHSAFWGVFALAFVIAGVIGVRKLLREKRRVLILLAMSGAFIFVISSLKIPSVTGSSSHMTDTGLSAILFGPAITSVLGLVVLVFQAILLAHGGLTTLGANAASMAIIGPFLAWGLYRLGKRLKVNKKARVFIAAMLGDLLSYCATSLQLAAAYPSEAGGFMASAAKFLGVFALAQVPLAVVEGILTVLIVMGMESFAKPELQEIAYMEAN